MSFGLVFVAQCILVAFLAAVTWRLAFRAGAIYAAKRVHEKNHPAGNSSGRWSPTACVIANEPLREQGALDEVEDVDEPEDESDGDE